MLEIQEFGVRGEFIHLLVDGLESKSLVHRVRFVAGDPQMDRLCALDTQLRAARGEPLFFGWHVERRYTAQELAGAALFHLDITAVFEPAGELCGTVYDDSTACSCCGAGRRQVSDLIVDGYRIPKGKDVAATIADERIVSQRLAEALANSRMTGFELRPVQTRGQLQIDATMLQTCEAGKELLRRAEQTHVDPASWQYQVWLGSDEQATLLREVIRERPPDTTGHDPGQQRRQASRWYQLVVVSRPVTIDAQTRIGVTPCEPDEEGIYRCPLGHVAGLNVLSELFVAGKDWDGSDVAQTKQLVGQRMGVLVPRHLLLISPRMFRLLVEHKVKGYKVEIARCV